MTLWTWECWRCGHTAERPEGTTCSRCGAVSGLRRAPRVHPQPELKERLSGDLPLLGRDTEPPVDTTSGMYSGTVTLTIPRADYERFVEDISFLAPLAIPRFDDEPPILLPQIDHDPRTWERVVHLRNGGTGRVAVKVRDDVLIVEVAVTEPGEDGRGRQLVTCATGRLDDEVRDLLADAREGIDRIPDELWDALSAPLEGEQDALSC